MTTEIQTVGNAADSLALVARGGSPLQPICNIVTYLADRTPTPNWEDEQPLMITLPSALQAETKALERACKFCQRMVDENYSVSCAVKETLAVFNGGHRQQAGWNPKTFRAKFDAYTEKRDWVILVNRAKAPASWRDGDVGLPVSFLDFVAKRFCQFKRDNGKRQALLSIKRQWQTGRNDLGRDEIISGYEADWSSRVRAVFPVGWDYSNILRQIKKHAAFTKALRALTHEGTAAARKHVPEVHATRAKLKFMELVEFDDVKTDFRVVDTQTGQTNDLWLLIARDKATTLLLGFGMRPARVRDDGSQEHLRLRDMKQLAGWILETYGLPPYKMTWKVEHATATFSEGSSRALSELIGPERLVVSYSAMLGKTSPTGYAERRIGNSQGKASLESLNNLTHNMLSHLPGQTGPLYNRRPADLAAREREAVETWKLAQFLPDHLRGQVEYSLLTIQQAREQLFRIFSLQNHRTDHAIEGFERIAEWFDGKAWQPAATAPDIRDLKVRSRMESPIERAAKLCNGIAFTRISPQIITSFYEHTQRAVTVQDNGEIQFTVEGKQIYFRAPQLSGSTQHCLAPGTKALAYFHPDDPRLLHLTDGKGAILGTWIRRALADNQAAAAEALRYSATAFNAVKERAENLLAEDRAGLDAMRARNAELMRFSDFVDVTPATVASGEITNNVATALTAVKAKKVAVRKDRSNDEREAREALANLAV